MKGNKLVRSFKAKQHNNKTNRSCVVWCSTQYMPFQQEKQYYIKYDGSEHEPILVNACTYIMQSKLEFCALVLFVYDWPYTGWSKILCAPDDYSKNTSKNILNSFNHSPW
jgi:hypothetical protein